MIFERQNMDMDWSVNYWTELLKNHFGWTGSHWCFSWSERYWKGNHMNFIPQLIGIHMLHPAFFSLADHFARASGCRTEDRRMSKHHEHQLGQSRPSHPPRSAARCFASIFGSSVAWGCPQFPALFLFWMEPEKNRNHSFSTIHFQHPIIRHSNKIMMIINPPFTWVYFMMYMIIVDDHSIMAIHILNHHDHSIIYFMMWWVR